MSEMRDVGYETLAFRSFYGFPHEFHHEALRTLPLALPDLREPLLPCRNSGIA